MAPSRTDTRPVAPAALRCPVCFWSGALADLGAHDVLEADADRGRPEYFCPTCGSHLIHARRP